LTDRIFCDGGVVGPNPSVLGITWAWVMPCPNNTKLYEAGGVLEPCDLGMDELSNNHAELIAALRALSFVGKDWTGTLYTDSNVTRHRLEGRGTYEGLTPSLISSLESVRKRRRYKVVLLGGHPTLAELKQGFKNKNNLPVSSWNCYCDQLCTALAGNFKRTLQDGPQELAGQ
jgi:ribonuclease HI